MASGEALWQISLLGLATGIASGLVIVGFRFLVESTQGSFLGGDYENYESLPYLWRFLLPLLGGLLIGLIFHWLSKEDSGVGIVHVAERLAYHQGRLPLRNALLQTFGAATSLISGQSVGREGPSIHLGAASASLLGQWLRLPNNSIRVLVGCGAAAAIAASFNTPLAGVIFAMEVILMEYTIASFTPVILAAVSSTLLTRLFYGDSAAFNVPAMTLQSAWELPYVLVLGLVIGTLAATFIHIAGKLSSSSFGKHAVWQRMTIAGALMGLVAVAAPQIMSIGYDTVNATLLGTISLSVLLLIVAAKLLASATAIGLGVPAGFIGPTLVIGAAAGAVMGAIGQTLFPEIVSNTGFYAMLGMAAMMAATLQAPLSALTAMVELTANPQIILPGMLAVIASGLTSRELFGKASLVLTLLQARGLDYRNNPVAQSLRRIGVTSVMDRSFAESTALLSNADALTLLRKNPQWIIVANKERNTNNQLLLRAADLARYTEQSASETINLLNIPAQRLHWVSIDPQSTLQEALEALNNSKADILVVLRKRPFASDLVYGVLSRDTIDANYHLKPRYTSVSNRGGENR